MCRTPLNGIIPKNIFKNNKTVRCNNLWKGQIIIPQLVHSWESENVIYNVYVHYPSGYTKSGILSESFNSEYIVLENNTIADKKYVNYSLVLLEDSISEVTTLSNAFLSNPRWSYFGQQLTTNTHQFNFIGKLSGDSIIMGLDPSKFTSLNMDALFVSPYLGVVNGNLFSQGFDAYYLKMGSENSTVINVQGLSGQQKYGISRFLILPRASGNINQLALNKSFIIHQDQIVDNVASVKYYEQSNWQVQKE